MKFGQCHKISFFLLFAIFYLFCQFHHMLSTLGNLFVFEMGLANLVGKHAYMTLECFAKCAPHCRHF